MPQPICPVDGCTRWSQGPRRPLCPAHAERLRKHGDVLAHRPLPTRRKSPGPASAQAHLYLLQAENGERVKIGRTSNVLARRLDIERVEGELFRIVSVIPNQGHLEAEVHGHFSRYQQVTEWFDPHPDIFQWFLDAERAPSSKLRALLRLSGAPR